MTSKTPWIAIGVLFLMLGGEVDAEASVRNALVLNSYHDAFKWTKEEVDGIRKALDSSDVPVKIYTEYMGTKWVFHEEYFAKLAELLQVKYRGIPFDLIVATDDDALNFLLKSRDAIFGKIPVVFCGVNWFSIDRLKGQDLYTGVNEDADIAANIDLMLRLHPNTKSIYFIADSTTTGIIVRQKIEGMVAHYQGRVQLITFSDMDLPALLDAVAAVKSDALVFLTIFQKDRTGRFVEYDEIARGVAGKSPVPVYGLWDFSLGFGIVGGMLSSGHAQGQNAGDMAKRILEGEKIQSIPILMKSPNIYKFDYLQLERFGISTRHLPLGSIVMNEPPSFYAITKGYVWGVLVSGLLGSMLIVALSLSIHRRKRAEKALRESEEKYRSLVEHLNVGVFRSMARPDGKFVQANPAMLKIYGYDSMEDFLSIPVVELYQKPAERTELIEELQKAGYLKDREVLMRKKDGTSIWVLCSAVAMLDKQGKILWTDGVHEDITERKKLEEQLRHAQKMEAIGTLAGGVAHDFNNILTAIIGYGNLMQMKIGKDHELGHYLDPILSASDKAAQLTRSLLAFSRKQIISLKREDLNEIVQGMGKILLRVIREDIDLQMLPSTTPLLVQVDRGQIEQVLLNLVMNARDAMPAGGCLSIETDYAELNQEMLIKHEFMKAGDYAVLSVADTGTGIPEDIRRRMFEPFFSTKSLGEGTGLGLSIVYGIIKQHNGDISVYSEIGRGTTFKIYLPLAAHLPSELPKEKTESPVIKGTETILIGEDNEGVRGLAKEALEEGGYTVYLASDGEAVVEMYRQHADKIDMLLLDVVMPKKNGKDVYDEIRLMRPAIKVLFMSGYTANIIHKKGVLDEGIQFIPKPLSPGQLLKKVREVLDAHKRELRSR